jgi:aminoglycoside phosphotransferase (APT) family kinase protein
LDDADLNGVTLLGSGIATNAYQVQASTGTWVVRISNDYPRPWRWRGGRRHEAPLLALLAARGLPLPRDPFAIDADDGFPVAIVERKVAGAPMTPTRQRAAPNPDQLAVELGHFLTELHRFPVAAAQALSVPAIDHGAESRQLLGEAAPFLTDRVYRRLDSQITEVERFDASPTLVHGDIRAEHLYLDPGGRLVGIIDYGDISISDPAYDFTKITTELGPAFGAALLKHYGNPIDPTFHTRIAIYAQLELLWEIARPDAVKEDRATALERLTSQLR